ncbi:hypothetical protein EUX98_g2139 [Antrodiella citrinella]|uniref:Uncharacterized protein n=1 Tax=Antrodiella citrinella TaxID=2447956 RepID=A0A4S4N2P9_9APHY|nr:hypothetical protein EUX98_g2139 [Antrodiella citrinella]
MSSDIVRRHKMAYKDHNGYLDETRMRIQGQSSIARDAENSAATKREKRDAVQKRIFAQHVLDTKGSFFPSIEEMKEAIAAPESSAAVQTRQNELKEKHKQDIQELYDYEAEQYLADAVDRYLSKDDMAPDPVIDSLYTSLRDPAHPFQTGSTSAWEAYRYAHLSAILPLQTLHTELAASELAQQRVKDSRFPDSLYRYRQIRNKETQLRIARFLAADKMTKERTMGEYGWAYRQVMTLETEYKENADFRTEVQERLRDLEATDPRRRATNK